VIEVLGAFLRVTRSYRPIRILTLKFAGRHQCIDIGIKKVADPCVDFGAVFVGEDGIDTVGYILRDVETGYAGGAKQERDGD
jgi:hypothetical protein